MNKIKLETNTDLNIRFSEVDSMGVVWHGNYLKFIEDGREDFGKKFGLGYLETFRAGLLIPIVNIECNYKRPIEYDFPCVINTRFIDSEAAKIIFEFTIFHKETKAVFCTAKSVQVFLDVNRELILSPPPFFMEWKKRMGLINE